MTAVSDRSPVLEVEHVAVHLPIASEHSLRSASRSVRAVDDVSFSVEVGETLGIVGESGCGKSTLLRAIASLMKPTAGAVRVNGTLRSSLSASALRNTRAEVQLVFQNATRSLNPRRRIGATLSDPLRRRGFNATERTRETYRLLDLVGLTHDQAHRLPRELSGGQCQRIGIARALAARPSVILFDEPVSALDTSVQAQILNLLLDLQEEGSLTYIFVAHDLAIVRQVCARVAVMYLGQIVEMGAVTDLYSSPRHPYTTALLEASPIPDPTISAARRNHPGLPGEPPSPLDPPGGCRFHPRCPRRTRICEVTPPPLTRYSDGRLTACHHPLSVTRELLESASLSTASPIAAGRNLPTG